MEIEDLRKQMASDMTGMQMALGSAIRALFKTHPDPIALVRELQREKEETIALLTASPIPDRAIDSFLVSMEFVDATLGFVPLNSDTQSEGE